MISSVQGYAQLGPSLSHIVPNEASKASQEADSVFSDWATALTYAGDQTSSSGNDTVTLSYTAQQLTRDGQETSGLAGTLNVGSSLNGVSIDADTPSYVKSVDLPDGETALQLGDVDASKDYFHKQGDNDLGYQGDCGLVSSGDVANQFGVNVSENYVVHYAVDNGLCTTSGSPTQRGATTVLDQEKVLDGLGVPSHIESGNTLEGLGRELEEGHGAIIEVNAGELWDNPDFYGSGKINHAVTVTGVAADPVTGQAMGIWIDDSGTGQYSRYVDADNAGVQGWLHSGSLSVVTDGEHS
jgi:hypothetical protein